MLIWKVNVHMEGLLEIKKNTLDFMTNISPPLEKWLEVLL